MLVVPDASVILKWVLPPDNEPYWQEAQALADSLWRGQLDLALPALWAFEVGNILGLKFPETADEDLHDLRSLLSDFERPLNDPWQRQILTLMQRHRVTFYDAAYHALAILEGGWFVTADERYLKTVDDLRHACHLREWQRKVLPPLK